METILARSKRTDKAQWLREAFLGATPQHKTLSEEKEEKRCPSPEPTRPPPANQGQQVLDLMFCLKQIYDNFALSREFRKRIRELVPDIKPPKPRNMPPYKLNAVEVEEGAHLVWLLRHRDGRVFVDLEFMLQQLDSQEPLEAYRDDNSYRTVQYEYPAPPDWDLVNGDFIEIKHVETLEEHSGPANSNLRAALDTILRSVPREE
jgi:hypothetical protein